MRPAWVNDKPVVCALPGKDARVKERRLSSGLRGLEFGRACEDAGHASVSMLSNYCAAVIGRKPQGA